MKNIIKPILNGFSTISIFPPPMPEIELGSPEDDAKHLAKDWRAVCGPLSDKQIAREIHDLAKNDEKV